MSIETDYYENAEFWDEEIFASHRPRFQAISDLIPADARSLVDIGCGNGAFVHFLSEGTPRFDEIHATDRSETALARVRAAKSLASIDALPFADRSFDVATSLEVIEHLPLEVYHKGLENICRVARSYVVLGVPFEENIEADLIRCPACTSRFNPDYHLRRYDEETLNHLLEPHGFVPVDKAMIGGMTRYFLVTDLMQRRRRAKQHGNPFHTAIPCPICGYLLPPEGAPPGAAPPPAPQAESSGLKAMVKSLLRTGTDYGTIAMLYKRVV